MAYATIVKDRRYIAQLEAKNARAMRIAHFVNVELALCERQVAQGATGVKSAVYILKIVKHRAAAEGGDDE